MVAHDPTRAPSGYQESYDSLLPLRKSTLVRPLACSRVSRFLTSNRSKSAFINLCQRQCTSRKLRTKLLNMNNVSLANPLSESFPQLKSSETPGRYFITDKYSAQGPTSARYRLAITLLICKVCPKS